MAARVFTPTNQKLLTNVAIVRMKKAGKRFEIACFKNKVMSWRQKVEKDIDEVLQIHTVFSNVTKGQVAKSADLKKAFGTEDHDEACLQILAKGELQVSKEERDAKLTDTYREIATIVSDKCVNPDTQRPYTTAQIERAMKDAHYSVKPNASAKAQALDVIRQLSESIPIDRALMTVRVVLPAKDAKRIKQDIVSLAHEVLEEDWDESLEIVCTIEPGTFRTLDETVRSETKGKGQVEIVSVKNVAQGDEEL